MADEQLGAGDDAIPKDVLEHIQNQRDNFQELKEDIKKSIIEQKRYAVQRYANWRLSLANISFALAVAVIPLLFFTDKRPSHPYTFYLGVLLLLANGFVAYTREKNDAEMELNALGEMGKPELHKIGVFVHKLNKVLFYGSKSLYRDYVKTSRSYVKESRGDLDRRTEDRTRTNVWNEFHLLTPAIASFLLLREVMGMQRGVFYASLVLLILASLLYVWLEYKKARKIALSGTKWDSKISDEDKEHEAWWEEIVGGK